MNITVAKQDDLQDLLEMLAEYQESMEPVITADKEKNENYLQQLLGDDKFGTVFIGRTSSKQPVAFAIVGRKFSTPDAVWLPDVQDLFVRESYRQKGFGRQMFDHLVRWAKKNGHTQLCWQVENLNLTAQYMFDVYNAASSGWIVYSLNLKKE